MVGLAFVMPVVLAGMTYGAWAIFGGDNSSLKVRRSRMVICPVTMKTAFVAIALGTISNSGYRALDRLRIGECSRWPANQDCKQECLKQTEARVSIC
jgi:hypothetical protein